MLVYEGGWRKEGVVICGWKRVTKGEPVWRVIGRFEGGWGTEGKGFRVVYRVWGRGVRRILDNF